MIESIMLTRGHAKFCESIRVLNFNAVNSPQHQFLEALKRKKTKKNHTWLKPRWPSIAVPFVLPPVPMLGRTMSLRLAIRQGKLCLALIWLRDEQDDPAQQVILTPDWCLVVMRMISCKSCQVIDWLIDWLIQMGKPRKGLKNKMERVAWNIFKNLIILF